MHAHIHVCVHTFMNVHIYKSGESSNTAGVMTHYVGLRLSSVALDSTTGHAWICTDLRILWMRSLSFT